MGSVRESGVWEQKESVVLPENDSEIEGWQWNRRVMEKEQK